MRKSSFFLLCIQCIYVLTRADDHDRERRDLSMLRMGKRAALSLPPLVAPNYDGKGDYERALLAEMEEPRQTWIPRVGKDLEYAMQPTFPRLGQSLDDYVNEIRREITDADLNEMLYPTVSRSRRSADTAEEQEKRDEKRASPFPRMGEEEEEEYMKRVSLLPRMGYLQSRTVPFPRIGYYDDVLDNYYEEQEKRSLPFPRLGLVQRAIPLPRMGYREKKAMGMLRMGRSQADIEEAEEKRGMGMLRMGKRPMSMLRMGKRPMSMLRMGRSSDNMEDEKRAMGMLRMGKRGMGMLRMGRSDEEADKRAMSMLRMGKRGMGMLRMGRSEGAEAEEKRGMGMLRMGRSNDAEAEEKRAMSMLRMGKRPVSMLRMGKRDTDAVDAADDAAAASNDES